MDLAGFGLTMYSWSIYANSGKRTKPFLFFTVVIVGAFVSCPAPGGDKGMKQRVSLARALVHDPQVLIMDEPAAGLDPRARIELRELLRVLAKQGKAVLISSHILSELEDICHGAVIIETGKLLKSGLIEELIVDGASDGDIREIVIRFTPGTMPDEKFFLEQPQVVNVNFLGENAVEIGMDATEVESARLMAALIGKGCGIVEFRQQSIGLEKLFMSVTNGKVQ